MEELEKIRDFLKRLKNEKNVHLPRLMFFADNSCSVSGFRGKRIISAHDIKSLLKQIDNYQWDTNTNNQNTASAKQ